MRYKQAWDSGFWRGPPPTCVHIYSLPLPWTPRFSGEQSGPLTSCHRKVSGRSRESVPWGRPQSSSLPAALAVGSVPVVLGAMGFTGAGIAASSIAAKMMSVAAVANGGGVAAGGLVATLQSVGRCPGRRRRAPVLLPASWSSVSLDFCVPLTVPTSVWGYGWWEEGCAAQEAGIPHQPCVTCVVPLPSLGPAECSGGRGSLSFLRGSVLSLMD